MTNKMHVQRWTKSYLHEIHEKYVVTCFFGDFRISAIVTAVQNDKYYKR